MLKPPRTTVPPSPGKSFRANRNLKFGDQAKLILGAKLFLSDLKNCPADRALPPTKSKVPFGFSSAALGSIPPVTTSSRKPLGSLIPVNSSYRTPKLSVRLGRTRH